MRCTQLRAGAAVVVGVVARDVLGAALVDDRVLDDEERDADGEVAGSVAADDVAAGDDTVVAEDEAASDPPEEQPLTTTAPTAQRAAARTSARAVDTDRR